LRSELCCNPIKIKIKTKVNQNTAEFSKKLYELFLNAVFPQMQHHERPTKKLTLQPKYKGSKQPIAKASLVHLALCFL